MCGPAQGERRSQRFRGMELKNDHPLDRHVVRPSLRRDAAHACVLDTHFLCEQCHLLPELGVLGLQPPMGD
jgi:hypothetical protein